MRFWTSDWHLGHQRIHEFEPGRMILGDTIEERDRELIKRFNSIVGPDDDLMVLGDVAMGDISYSLPLVANFVGNLHLVPGNHDRCWIGDKRSRNWQDRYEAVGFNIVPEQCEALIGETLVNVCHFPYTGESDSDREDRYTGFRIPESDTPIIHGHVHGAWKTNGRQFNVGIDANEFFPVSDEEIENWLQTL